MNLFELCKTLPFKPHRIHVDRTGRYEEDLAGEFPFLIKLFHFRSGDYTPGLTWHERLELFIPLDGRARQWMGGKITDLKPGELLVVDNDKLHGVADFPGFDARVAVISFLPEFVYSLGSPSHDYTFLLPFYTKTDSKPHVVRRGAKLLPEIHVALAGLLECYFDKGNRQYYQAGCKARLLELLYLLARHFQSSELLKSEFIRQQERSHKLRNVFEFVRKNYADRISLARAAALAGMSGPQFIKIFKKVAGMTFTSYVTHVRVTNGMRLLKETGLTIAEVASQTGFADQSHFNRRFKSAFGKPPTAFRPKPSGG